MILSIRFIRSPPFGEAEIGWGHTLVAMLLFLFFKWSGKQPGQSRELLDSLFQLCLSKAARRTDRRRQINYEFCPKLFPSTKGLKISYINPPTPLWRWRRAYWGAIGYTNCSMTFVNIAVAISALAGGGCGPKTVSHQDRNFPTESKSCGCFRAFSTIFGCLSFRMHGLNGILGHVRSFWSNFNGILGHFGRLLAMEKRPKGKKHCN